MGRGKKKVPKAGEKGIEVCGGRWKGRKPPLRLAMAHRVSRFSIFILFFFSFFFVSFIFAFSTIFYKLYPVFSPVFPGLKETLWRSKDTCQSSTQNATIGVIFAYRTLKISCDFLISFPGLELRR